MLILYPIDSSPNFGPILSQTNPVYYPLLFYTYKTHFNIIPSYKRRFPNLLFRPGFQCERFNAFLLSLMHIACPAFLILILSPDNIWPEVQITNQQKEWWGKFWWQCKQACINLFCAPPPPKKRILWEQVGSPSVSKTQWPPLMHDNLPVKHYKALPASKTIFLHITRNQRAM